MGDYFDHASRRQGNAVNQDRLNAPLPQTPGIPGTPGGRRPGGAPSLESMRAPSSIRIRRLPSALNQPTLRTAAQETAPTTGATSGRRRSSSDPHRYGGNLAPPGMDLARQRTAEEARMPTLTEESTLPRGQRAQDGGSGSSDYYEDAYSQQENSDIPRPDTPSTQHESPIATPPASRVVTGASAMQNAGNAARANRGLQRHRTAVSMRNQTAADEYNTDVVDLLDLVDPEVRTIGTLNNIQNSLFVPDLGRLINRRPTYNLTRGPTATGTTSYFPPERGEGTGRSRAGTGARPPQLDLPSIPQGSEPADAANGDIELQPSRGRRFSISSNLSDSRYAVLPHGVSLEDWTDEDKAELDDHVRHLMHSRKEGFKRSMRGFKQYISKPLGLFVFVYATLVTLFGAAWVFFLIGWIYVGDNQQYIINIVDNILVALFALMGDGLAPFRAVDTYHMCFIAKYYHATWRLRKEKQLPALVDHNDLPDRRASQMDIEDQIDKEEFGEMSVLKPLQQIRLQYHQAKFSKAHTFYRPHETATHHAFPLRLLVAVVVLLDCHSLFQVALGTCTWSIYYKTRPEALTATILSCSITCNIVAGILISVGDHRTRKKDVLERIERQNLTEEALGRMAKKRQSTDIARKSMEASRAVAERDKERDAEYERMQQVGGPSVMVSTPSHEDEKKNA